MSDLKLCPFCGQEQDETTPELEYLGSGPPPGYAYRCGYCGASGPMGTGKSRGDDAGGKEAAATEWNRRAEKGREPLPKAVGGPSGREPWILEMTPLSPVPLEEWLGLALTRFALGGVTIGDVVASWMTCPPAPGGVEARPMKGDQP